MYIFLIMVIIMSILFLGVIYVSLISSHNKECIYGIEDRIFKKVYREQWDYEVILNLTKTIIEGYNEDKSLEECKKNTKIILRDKKILNRFNDEYMDKYINLIYLVRSLDEN